MMNTIREKILDFLSKKSLYRIIAIAIGLLLIPLYLYVQFLLAPYYDNVGWFPHLLFITNLGVQFVYLLVSIIIIMVIRKISKLFRVLSYVIFLSFLLILLLPIKPLDVIFISPFYNPAWSFYSTITSSLFLFVITLLIKFSRRQDQQDDSGIGSFLKIEVLIGITITLFFISLVFLAQIGNFVLQKHLSDNGIWCDRLTNLGLVRSLTYSQERLYDGFDSGDPMDFRYAKRPYQFKDNCYVTLAYLTAEKYEGANDSVNFCLKLEYKNTFGELSEFKKVYCTAGSVIRSKRYTDCFRLNGENQINCLSVIGLGLNSTRPCEWDPEWFQKYLGCHHYVISNFLESRYYYTEGGYTTRDNTTAMVDYLCRESNTSAACKYYFLKHLDKYNYGYAWSVYYTYSGDLHELYANISFCNKIEINSEKNECLLNAVKYKSNIESCNEIENVTIRGKCLIQKFNFNLSFCNKIEVNSKKNECILATIKDSNVIGLCGEIEDFAVRKECELEREVKYYGSCGHIENYNKRIECQVEEGLKYYGS